MKIQTITRRATALLLALLLTGVFALGALAEPTGPSDPTYGDEVPVSAPDEDPGADPVGSPERYTGADPDTLPEEYPAEPVALPTEEEVPAAPAEGPEEISDDAAEKNAVEPYSPGDPDGDGEITASDARLALRIAVGLETPDETDPAYLAADADGDPGVTAADARVILRAAVGLMKIGEPEPHVHRFKETVVEPTCTAQGYTVYECECGERYIDDYTPAAHKYYRFKCIYCGQEDPLHYALPFETDFEQTLYDTAHPLFYRTADELSFPGTGLDKVLEYAYHSSSKWCCYYTVHDVFRPALFAAGYTREKIDRIAPVYYPSSKIAKVLGSAAGMYVPPLLMTSSVPVYVPSLLMDYYFTHPEYAETWRFTTFYDDMVTQQIYERTENADEYVPQVGDILFMSNKEETYVNGYKTVDHTAQIIQLYADGSFWCTEGSIIQTNEDGKPRVRERMYQMNKETGAYEYAYAPIVVVLAIARPNLDK